MGDSHNQSGDMQSSSIIDRCGHQPYEHSHVLGFPSNGWSQKHQECLHSIGVGNPRSINQPSIEVSPKNGDPHGD